MDSSSFTCDWSYLQKITIDALKIEMLQDQDEMSLWARVGNEEDNLCPKGHLLVYVSYKLQATCYYVFGYGFSGWVS
jgi:hypothetical protein